MFDSWFPCGSQLRDLAQEIATLRSAVGGSFLTGPDWPHNFLANAELGGAWHKPPSYTAGDIADWKSGYRPAPLTVREQHGFKDGSPLTRRGLSLLFDPFVDAFLAAHMQVNGAILPGSTVIVLTDYHPLATAVTPSARNDDWGHTETVRTLAGMAADDLTTQNLFACLFGPGWKVASSTEISPNPAILNGVAREHRVLLWNFLPLFRGGTIVEERAGLPISGNWRNLCWEWMCKFIAAVGAMRVVLACSDEMLQLPRKRPAPRPDLLPLLPDEVNAVLQPPTGSATFAAPPLLGAFKPLPTCVKELYRIYHPRSWRNSACNDCPTLKAILSRP